MPTMAAADMPTGVYEGVGAAEHGSCADHGGKCKAPEPYWWHSACADCELETVSGPGLAYRSMGPSPRCPRRGEFHICYDKQEKRDMAMVITHSIRALIIFSATFLLCFCFCCHCQLFVLFPPPFFIGCPLFTFPILHYTLHPLSLTYNMANSYTCVSYHHYSHGVIHCSNGPSPFSLLLLFVLGNKKDMCRRFTLMRNRDKGMWKEYGLMSEGECVDIAQTFFFFYLNLLQLTHGRFVFVKI